MSNDYATNVEHFVTHEDVTWRETADGFSLLVAVGVLGSTLALIVWWWRRRA